MFNRRGYMYKHFTCNRIRHKNKNRKWPRQIIPSTSVVVVTNIVKQSKTPNANQMEHGVMTREYI